MDDFADQAKLICSCWISFYLIDGDGVGKVDGIGVEHGSVGVVIFDVVFVCIVVGIFFVCQLVDLIGSFVIVVKAAARCAIWVGVLAQDRGCLSWAV